MFYNFFSLRTARSHRDIARIFVFSTLLLCNIAFGARAQDDTPPTTPPTDVTPANDARKIEARPARTPLPPVVTPPVIVVAPPADVTATAPAEDGNVSVTTSRQTTATGSVIAPGNVTPSDVPNISVSQTNMATPAAPETADKNAEKTPSVKAPGVLPERGKYTITGTPDRLSVFAVAVDAPELLTAIAAKADLKLLIDDEVSRKLTVNFVGRPAIQIVRDITVAYGLGFAEIDGIFMVSEGIPRTPGSYLLSDIESVSTKYVDAANARNLLPVFLQDYVKVNSEQNAVVLSAPPDILNKFRDDIARFDTPASQILVDFWWSN